MNFMLGIIIKALFEILFISCIVLSFSPKNKTLYTCGRDSIKVKKSIIILKIQIKSKIIYLVKKYDKNLITVNILLLKYVCSDHIKLFFSLCNTSKLLIISLFPSIIINYNPTVTIPTRLNLNLL